MKDTFLQAIREEYPNEQVTRLVFADWCLENLPELEEKLRIHIPPIDELSPNYVYDDEDGDGHRHRRGNGHGYEYGHAYGYGLGNGYGYGIGHGFGLGNGHGFGYSFGYGFGYNYQNLKLNMPKLHTNQLILLPFGFAFFGYVEEQIEPYVFRVVNASIILDKDVSWQDLAQGLGRDFSYRHVGSITIGPQIFHSMDWTGEVPILQ